MKTKAFLFLGFILGLFVQQAKIYGQAITIDGNNDVGMGQTNPIKRLHLEDNADEIQLMLENDQQLINGSYNTKSGAGIRFENANNHNYYLINESNNGWGHTNTFDIRTHDGYIPFQIYSDHHINLNHMVKIDMHSQLHWGETGNCKGASGFDFNPNKSYGGFMIEQSNSEGSGFYSDGDYAVIWSPGDYNRLLRVYDEDGMYEKWYINGSGYDYHNSDGRKKENIRNIKSSLAKLKKVTGIKYNFKKEEITELAESEQTLKSGTSKPDSIWPGDVDYKDHNKYDPSKDEYYGFIAQDIEKIFPEVVDTNEKGNKFICYTQFIPILVEAFKEQQTQLEKKDQDMKKLNQRIAKLENVIQKLKTNSQITRK